MGASHMGASHMDTSRDTSTVMVLVSNFNEVIDTPVAVSQILYISTLYSQSVPAASFSL